MEYLNRPFNISPNLLYKYIDSYFVYFFTITVYFVHHSVKIKLNNVSASTILLIYRMCQFISNLFYS